MTNSGIGTPAQILQQIQATLSAYNLSYGVQVDQVTGNASFTTGPYAGQHIISSPLFDPSQPAADQNLLTILCVPVDSSGANGPITVVTGPDSGEQIVTSPSIGWQTILIGTLLVGIPLPGFGGGAADAAAGPSADLGADAGSTAAVAGPSATLATAPATAAGTTVAATTAAGGTAAAAATVGTVATATGIATNLLRTILGPTTTPAAVAPTIGISPMLLIVGAAILLLALEHRQ